MEEDFPQIDLPDFGGQAEEAEEAVPVSAPQRAAAQPAPQQDDGGDIFASLGDAITAGLQGLQEMFGLSPAQAAVPDPQGQNMQGGVAMFRGAGAYSGEEMKAIRKTVDPQDKLTEGVANLAGLMNAYDTFTARGDSASAKKMAASIIQYSQQRSIALGGLALEAMKDGNYSDGAKALVQAFNVIPNGQQVSIENGIGVVKDMKSGKVVKELKLTPQVMIAAAGKLASGEDYYKMLVQTASGKPPSLDEATALSDDELNRRWEGKGFIDPRGASKDQLGWIKEENTRRYQNELEASRTAKADAEAEKAAKKEAAEAEKAAKKEAANDQKAEAARMKEARGRNLTAFDAMWDEHAQSKGYPKDIANDIRDTTEYILEENDVHPTAGIRAAQKIVDPRSKVELKPAEKGGGGTVVIDGDEINFNKSGFNAVKRLREGYSKTDKKTEGKDANAPSAAGLIGEGVKGAARGWLEDAKKNLSGRPVSSLDPSQDGQRPSAIDLGTVTTSSGYRERFANQ